MTTKPLAAPSAPQPLVTDGRMHCFRDRRVDSACIFYETSHHRGGWRKRDAFTMVRATAEPAGLPASTIAWPSTRGARMRSSATITLLHFELTIGLGGADWNPLPGQTWNFRRAPLVPVHTTALHVVTGTAARDLVGAFASNEVRRLVVPD